MKTLTSLLAASVLLIGATAAQADYDFEQNEKETVRTEAASSRSEAYQLGLNKLTQLQSVSPRQLFNELDIFSLDADESSTRIEDGAYITVQKRTTPNGQARYVGLVNVDVTYFEERDDD